MSRDSYVKELAAVLLENPTKLTISQSRKKTNSLYGFMYNRISYRGTIITTQTHVCTFYNYTSVCGSKQKPLAFLFAVIAEGCEITWRVRSLHAVSSQHYQLVDLLIFRNYENK